jgi:very-short-patch-repair endonuclease
MTGVGRETSISLTKLAQGPLDQAIAAIAARQYGVITLAQLTALGLSASAVRMRIAAGRLHRVHRGVYCVGHRLLSPRGEWMAATRALGADALLSGGAAAALWDLVRRQRGPIDVTVTGRGGRSRRRGIVVHRRQVAAEQRTVRDRIAVPSVARTLLDLAEVVDAGLLQRAYERAAKLELLDLRAIERTLAIANGRRGAAALAALLPYDPAAAAAANSELELMFCDLIRSADLPEPQVNVLVGGFLVDAYWPHAGLVVELDGYEFHSDRPAFEGDHVKMGKLLLAGYLVLPLTYRQVADTPEWVIGAVRELLAQGGSVTRSRALRRG